MRRCCGPATRSPPWERWPCCRGCCRCCAARSRGRGSSFGSTPAFATPEVFDFLDACPRLDYVVSMPKNAVLVRHAEPAMTRARARSARTGQHGACLRRDPLCGRLLEAAATCRDQGRGRPTRGSRAAGQSPLRRDQPVSTASVPLREGLLRARGHREPDQGAARRTADRPHELLPVRGEPVAGPAHGCRLCAPAGASPVRRRHGVRPLSGDVAARPAPEARSPRRPLRSPSRPAPAPRDALPRTLGAGSHSPSEQPPDSTDPRHSASPVATPRPARRSCRCSSFQHPAIALRPTTFIPHRRPSEPATSGASSSRPITTPARHSRTPFVLELRSSGIIRVKHRAIPTPCYATGLRISEALHLTVSAVDSRRTVLHVANGKGQRHPPRDALAEAAGRSPPLVAGGTASALALSRRPPGGADDFLRIRQRGKQRLVRTPAPVRRAVDLRCDVYHPDGRRATGSPPGSSP